MTHLRALHHAAPSPIRPPTRPSLARFLWAGLLANLVCLGVPGARADGVSSQPVDFQELVYTPQCTLVVSQGSLGVSRDARTLSSDVAELGAEGRVTREMFGNPQPGLLSAYSNLTTAARVQVASPTLSGGTSPSTSEVRIGGSPFATSAEINIPNADGTLPPTEVHVKFSAATGFKAGSYNARAIATCYAQ
ncbi:hypothetical protein [Aphanothece minutissima]|uniref:Uncharacterized protein n=1 Tax=Aphanothece cf. minutissima CCALA 015 TaxID=2107695 RepID=A0ABX5F6U0_9CHRO|nr:hypothetical protein [Aphanothece minutissima]PSB36559.1 hypothetical protein C7B81_13390 [Aphanothece cf. minutissima CCALA 015]